MAHNFEFLRGLFNDYLTKQLVEKDPRGLYDPVNYIMQLGGKRIRPVATLMACEMFGDKAEKALPVAYALEMFHNFTLAHDDVMDNAIVRRGQEAMHVKYGLNSAILSGDVMMIQAFRIIQESTQESELRNSLLHIFSQTAIEICEGQQLDMDFETTRDVRLSEYLRMIKLKTAVLLGACLRCGALIGGAMETDAAHLYDFGIHLGLAFQIRDDVLDLYGDQQDFGKKRGGDILQKKKTFLYLKALELSDAKSAQGLIAVYEDMGMDPIQKLDRVMQIFDELEIRHHAQDYMQDLTHKAMEHLEAIRISDIQKAELVKLARLLLGREQ